MEKFLLVLANKKEFWSKVILEFIGIEGEEYQTNFLAQHDRFLQIYSKSLANDPEHGESSQIVDSKLRFLSTKKIQETELETDINARRGTYYNAGMPNIIDNYNLMAVSDSTVTNSKIIKVNITDFRQFHDEIEYVLSANYNESKHWTVTKTFGQITNHRRKVAKKYPQLNLPVISQSGNSQDRIIMDKRKYEIQAYIDFLQNSKALNKALCTLVDFESFANSTTSMHSNNGMLTPEASNTGINGGYQNLEKSDMSRVTINWESEDSFQVIGRSFRGEESLFSSMSKARDDDSDEDF